MRSGSIMVAELVVDAGGVRFLDPHVDGGVVAAARAVERHREGSLRAAARPPLRNCRMW